PAEIWVQNSEQVSKLIMSRKEVTSVELDPLQQTADTDQSNNHFPPKIRTSRFRLHQQRNTERNQMQRAGLGKQKEEAASDKAAAEQKDGEKKE
ncbi:MAG: hypothetical protein KDA96_17485, partial [Planctomycetaceae bacterium]|nr:hypothetical protein [Planctomycetaceae bacterium]